jgi:hypothetical protein
MKTKLIATVASIGFTTLGVTGLAFAQDNANRQSGNPTTERMEKGNANEGAQRKMNERPAQTGQAEPQKREGETRTGQNPQGEKREGETRTGQNPQGEKREGETRTGQNPQGEKREGETRTGQNPQGEKREGETRTGQNPQGEKREGETRTGQNPQGEKREGETRTGQNPQGEKREGETRTGQNPQGEKREGETRTGQNPQGEKREGETRTGQNPQGGNREGPAPGGKRDVSVRGNLHISRENASRISENLVRQGHRENVNFNINVGAPLPTDVALLPLPPDVVELAPEYRGYDYVLVNDEIVFVSPSTRDVVGMIELGASSADAGPPSRIAGAKPCPVD